MATVALPASALVTDLTLEYRTPGQVIHRSIYTGTTQVLTRGAAWWAGTVTLGATDARSDAARAEVEAFLASLEGWANDFRLPVRRKVRLGLAAGTVLRVASATLTAAGHVSITTAPAATIPVGDYITVGNRLYVAVAGGANRFLPAPVPTAGAAVTWAEPYALARLAGDTPEAVPSPLTPDGGGPWVLGWEEAI